MTRTVVVLVPEPGGGWAYSRAFRPMDLTESQQGYVKGMGASLEDDGGTIWIRVKDDREVVGYLTRLREELRRNDNGKDRELQNGE